MVVMYDDVTTLFDEARLMIHRSVVVVEQLHDGNGVSVPMRAVLEYLRTHGEHTVSAIARARSVSRQHIQTIVNDLLDAGLVERKHNPNHLRAPLIELTRSGSETIDAMHATERAVLEPVLVGPTGLTQARLVAAIEVLSAVSTALQVLTTTPDEIESVPS
jgi:DNA-binding MarR family transcriptional regulator